MLLEQFKHSRVFGKRRGALIIAYSVQGDTYTAVDFTHLVKPEIQHAVGLKSSAAQNSRFILVQQLLL